MTGESCIAEDNGDVNEEEMDGEFCDAQDMVDEAGFVDAFTLKKEWCTQSRILKKQIRKYRYSPTKILGNQQGN